jgi:hypothetical protein
VLELPWFEDQYHAHYVNRGFAVPSGLVSVDWRSAVRGDLAINDINIAPVLNSSTGQTNLGTPRPHGKEIEVRGKLAQIGFKPDANSWVKGGLIHPLTFSRVQDVEGLTATRGYPFPALDPLIQSMVVPYTIGTITPGGFGNVPINIPVTLGITNIHGWHRTWPWPRVLVGLRVWNVNTNTKHWPRGHIFAGNSASGPRYQHMNADGTFLLQRSLDPQLAPANNIIILQGGVTYAIQVGHVEVLGGTFYHQRWPGYTWKPGDGITY